MGGQRIGHSGDEPGVVAASVQIGRLRLMVPEVCRLFLAAHFPHRPQLFCIDLHETSKWGTPQPDEQTGKLLTFFWTGPIPQPDWREVGSLEFLPGRA